jgi:hypothetical protein
MLKKVGGSSVFLARGMPDELLVAARLLGGVTALLKVEGGIVGQYVSNECVKIMG